MGACPVVDYGIPETGATEYSVSSGRELFQCGNSCVKLFIVNLTVETTTVTISCGSIDQAVQGDICLRSANVGLQDQAIVNWVAKDDVDTNTEVGYVINRAKPCGGGESTIYTHTDGQMSIRVTANIDSIISERDNLESLASGKLAEVCTGQVATMIGVVDFIFSDTSTDASPTDWQGGGLTFQAFGTDEGAGGTRTARANFNWQNGQAECRDGSLEYDETATPQDVGALIDAMIA